MAAANAAQAKEAIIDAAPLSGKQVRLDGMLREWPAMNALSEHVSGHAGDDDPRVEGIVGYDNNNLYVAMRIKDASFVRTPALGTSEDHALLRLAFPSGAGFKSYEVRFYPGVPGRSPGAVKLAGAGSVRGAKIVEAPAQDGLTFEASIPWDTFPQARRVRGGLRGSLVFVDADAPGKVSAVVATSKRKGASAPALTLEAEYSLNRGLVFPKGLNARADKELFGNVVGDQMLERLAIYGSYLSVTGWNYRNGSEFYFQDLQVPGYSNIKRFELHDCTGDGHDDVVIQRRVASSGRAQELLEVWHFRGSDDGPQLIFQHEVGLVAGEASISNVVKIKGERGHLSIIVSQGEHSKVDPASWDAPVAGGVTFPLLLPWQPVKSRTYEWKAGKFEETSEATWKPKMAGPKRGTRMWSGSKPPPSYGGEAPPHRSAAASSEAPVSAAPPPRPPSAEEMMERVYALYRADRGAKRAKPRFDFVTNVASDEVTERVLVHGKDIVVFGRQFKEGTSYAFTTIGVKEPSDVLDVTARDVTGDGRAEIIVRGVLTAQASKRLGGDLVTRHALFIYKVGGGEIHRIFAAETGRSVGDKSVLGHIRFVPQGRGLGIELRPGRAVGWKQNTYPFPQDRLPYAGLEPLLLPWSDMPSRSYRYEGGAYKQQ